MASFLDPRFKAQYLGDELPLIKQRVIREGVEIVGSGGIDEDSEDVLVSGGIDKDSEGGAPQSKRHKLSSWLKEAPQRTEQKVKSQIENNLKCKTKQIRLNKSITCHAISGFPPQLVHQTIYGNFCAQLSKSI